MINYIIGDLFTTPDTVIVHGCNSKGVMGSGVAKIVKDLYPKAFKEYASYCDAILEDHLDESTYMGHIVTVPQSDGRIICNMITQKNYGKYPHKYVSYDAIDRGMQLLNACASVPQYKSISMPKIGATRGGGDWDIIEQIIKSRCKDINVNVYYL
jgi:O-acetyl-ADP-ribose deacetylase (regulator of RNase III)